jgi:hypothetical protein
MLILVRIDLSSADLALFEAYEERVLALLPTHGGRLDARLRAADDTSEVQLIEFSTPQGLASFRSDPARLAAQDMWTRCGAISEVLEVRRMNA